LKYRVTVAGRSFEIIIDRDRLVWVDGRPLYVDMEQVGGLPVYSLALDDQGYVVFVEEGQDEYRVEVQGRVFPVQVECEHPRLAPRRQERPDDRDENVVISSPLPGRLISLAVQAGDQVAAGQVVAVVESMKMHMALKSPRGGWVQAVHGPPGRDVDQDEELVILSIQ
jgi:propionyl-CoA carboxylase alpha chain